MHYPVAAIIVAAAATYAGATWLADRVSKHGFALPNERSRIGCVDGLRGYLALSVLISHGIIWIQVTGLGGTWRAPTINAFNEFGAASVALFFMVTGLVFYPRIQRGFDQVSWPALFINRFFRIVPLQFATVALITCIIAAQTGASFDRRYFPAFAEWMTGRYEPPLLGYAFSARVNAHVLWSLWYEWLFYLLVMPVCAFAAELVRDRLPSITVAFGLLLVGSLAMAFDLRPRLLELLPLFAFGMIAYECRASERVCRALSSPAATFGAIAALFVAINIGPAPSSFVAVALLGFFFVCVACGNSLGGLLSSNGARVLGEISFGTYLVHGIVLYGLFTAGRGMITGMSPGTAFAIMVPIAGLLVVLFASIAHVYVERPAIRLGALLANSWTARPFRRQERFAA